MFFFFNLIDLPKDVKYRLLDEDQKDRIIYLKPICENVLLNEFESSESISNSIQLAKLSSNLALRKMLSRSLDLLRHDKIENFEKLAEQLKQEYKITNENDFENVSITLSDIVFTNLIKTALMDKKILLKLELDKSVCRPYEEVIDFERSTPNSRKNLQKVNLSI